MTLQLNLSPETEAALKAQAEAMGMSAEDYAHEALRQMLVTGKPVSLQDLLSPEEWVREFRAWAQSHDRTTPLLSAEAIRRENIYPDRF
jgi:plasmid stability protein